MAEDNDKAAELEQLSEQASHLRAELKKLMNTPLDKGAMSESLSLLVKSLSSLSHKAKHVGIEMNSEFGALSKYIKTVANDGKIGTDSFRIALASVVKTLDRVSFSASKFSQVLKDSRDVLDKFSSAAQGGSYSVDDLGSSAVNLKTKMLVMGASIAFAGAKIGDLALNARDTISTFNRYGLVMKNVSRISPVAPGGTAQLESMRRVVGTTRKEFSDFLPTLRDIGKQGFTLGDLSGEARNVVNMFGEGSQAQEALKEVADLIKTMPTMRTDLSFSASVDDRTAALFALAEKGQVDVAITAGWFGAAEKTEEADVATSLARSYVVQENIQKSVADIEKLMHSLIPAAVGAKEILTTVSSILAGISTAHVFTGGMAKGFTGSGQFLGDMVTAVKNALSRNPATKARALTMKEAGGATHVMQTLAGAGSSSDKRTLKYGGGWGGFKSSDATEGMEEAVDAVTDMASSSGKAGKALGPVASKALVAARAIGGVVSAADAAYTAYKILATDTSKEISATSPRFKMLGDELKDISSIGELYSQSLNQSSLDLGRMQEATHETYSEFGNMSDVAKKNVTSYGELILATTAAGAAIGPLGALAGLATGLTIALYDLNDETTALNAAEASRNESVRAETKRRMSSLGLVTGQEQKYFSILKSVNGILKQNQEAQRREALALQSFVQNVDAISKSQLTSLYTMQAELAKVRINIANELGGSLEAFSRNISEYSGSTIKGIDKIIDSIAKQVGSADVSDMSGEVYAVALQKADKVVSDELMKFADVVKMINESIANSPNVIQAKLKESLSGTGMTIMQDLGGISVDQVGDVFSTMAQATTDVMNQSIKSAAMSSKKTVDVVTTMMNSAQKLQQQKINVLKKNEGERGGGVAESLSDFMGKDMADAVAKQALAGRGFNEQQATAVRGAQEQLREGGSGFRYLDTLMSNGLRGLEANVKFTNEKLGDETDNKGALQNILEQYSMGELKQSTTKLQTMAKEQGIEQEVIDKADFGLLFDLLEKKVNENFGNAQQMNVQAESDLRSFKSSTVDEEANALKKALLNPTVLKKQKDPEGMRRLVEDVIKNAQNESKGDRDKFDYLIKKNLVSNTGFGDLYKTAKTQHQERSQVVETTASIGKSANESAQTAKTTMMRNAAEVFKNVEEGVKKSVELLDRAVANISVELRVAQADVDRLEPLVGAADTFGMSSELINQYNEKLTKKFDEQLKNIAINRKVVDNIFNDLFNALEEGKNVDFSVLNKKGVNKEDLKKEYGMTDIAAEEMMAAIEEARKQGGPVNYDSLVKAVKKNRSIRYAEMDKQENEAIISSLMSVKEIPTDLGRQVSKKVEGLSVVVDMAMSGLIDFDKNVASDISQLAQVNFQENIKSINKRYEEQRQMIREGVKKSIAKLGELGVDVDETTNRTSVTPSKMTTEQTAAYQGYISSVSRLAIVEAEKQKRYNEENMRMQQQLFDIRKKEYDYEMSIIDARQQKSEAEAQVLEQMGSNIGIWMEKQREIVGFAKERADQARALLDYAVKNNLGSAKIAELTLKSRQAELELVNKSVQAQRSMFDKMLGAAVGQIGKMGVFNRGSNAQLYGRGYATSTAGVIIRGGAMTKEQQAAQTQIGMFKSSVMGDNKKITEKDQVSALVEGNVVTKENTSAVQQNTEALLNKDVVKGQQPQPAFDVFKMITGGFGKAMSNFFNNIPHFAEGGEVKKKTLAIVGENGPETIIPKKKLTHNNDVQSQDDIVSRNKNELEDVKIKKIEMENKIKNIDQEIASLNIKIRTKEILIETWSKASKDAFNRSRVENEDKIGGNYDLYKKYGKYRDSSLNELNELSSQFKDKQKNKQKIFKEMVQLQKQIQDKKDNLIYNKQIANREKKKDVKDITKDEKIVKKEKSINDFLMDPTAEEIAQYDKNYVDPEAARKKRVKEEFEELKQKSIASKERVFLAQENVDKAQKSVNGAKSKDERKKALIDLNKAESELYSANRPQRDVDLMKKYSRDLEETDKNDVVRVTPEDSLAFKKHRQEVHERVESAGKQNRKTIVPRAERRSNDQLMKRPSRQEILEKELKPMEAVTQMTTKDIGYARSQESKQDENAATENNKLATNKRATMNAGDETVSVVLTDNNIKNVADAIASNLITKFSSIPNIKVVVNEITPQAATALTASA